MTERTKITLLAMCVALAAAGAAAVRVDAGGRAAPAQTKETSGPRVAAMDCPTSPLLPPGAGRGGGRGARGGGAGIPGPRPVTATDTSTSIVMQPDPADQITCGRAELQAIGDVAFSH